jgi:tetratricopeptide (TPR) repeat protein
VLLEKVKTDLKDATAPSPRVVAAEATCAAILNALPQCLPPAHKDAALLTAKAHNRRGDALLLLGRAEEALACFQAAQPLAPDDA